MEKLPRMNLVNTAVKFLQNPKVQESNKQDQITFLEKKGLSQEEIDLAFAQIVKSTYYPPVPVLSPSVKVEELSTWIRLREHFVSFVIFGGVTYAIYKFVKVYVLPLFWEDPLEKRLRGLEERLERHLSVVEETMKQMREMMRNELRQQNFDLVRNRSSDDFALNEIKTGITTLKGLLLNRRQFPPTPVSQPVIPSWQRESLPKEGESVIPSWRELPSKEGVSSRHSSRSSSPSRTDLNPKVTSSWVTVDATSLTSLTRHSDDEVQEPDVPSKMDDVIAVSDDVSTLNGYVSTKIGADNDDVTEDVISMTSVSEISGQ